MLKLPIKQQSHIIETLEIHFPNKQMILFPEGKALEAFEASVVKNTKPEAWFFLNNVLMEHLNQIINSIMKYLNIMCMYKKPQDGRNVNVDIIKYGKCHVNYVHCLKRSL